MGSSSIVHLVMFLCIPVWKCLHVCSCTCASHAWVCLSANHRTCCWQAIHSLDSPFWSCSSGGAKSGACHPNHQLLTTPPQFSIISRAALSLLSKLSFSWAPESGLWPVDECYILAVSTGVSWGLACGGSAVSGPVCQLLVRLPPAPRHRPPSVAQTYVELWLTRISGLKMKASPSE